MAPSDGCVGDTIEEDRVGLSLFGGTLVE